MQEPDYKKIGQRIRQVRKARGWSQGTLAAECGISMSFMGHIERGTRIMSLDTFACICHVLGVTADELLWGVPEAGQAVLAGIWEQSAEGGRNADSYMMYMKIMKSVARIMSGA